jgi:HD-like signal output (HDOD) protein
MMVSMAGKPDKASKDLELEVRIGTEIRNIGIPPRPDILNKIDGEMRKEEPDYRHLAEIISSDVSLAASVIKVSNSPYYGFGRKVRSVPEALLVLGLKVAIQTIAGIALRRTFPHVPSLERFWDSAACTARVSGWLARRLHDSVGIRPDDAYTFGLFRDCGIPILMIPFPEYRDILGRANQEKERPFTAVEDELLSINHAVVGAELAEDWLLPEDTFKAMRHHHRREVIDGSEPGDVPLQSRQLIALGQIAEHLIQLATGMNRTCEWGKLGEACLQVLALDAGALTTLESDAREVIASGD